MKHFPTFLLITIFLFGCSEKRQGKDFVARAYDKVLVKADIAGVVPSGVHGKDSLDMIKSYVQSWIENQVMLRQSENNLEAEQKNFEREIESYRNSLVVYTYQKEFVRQKLDTSVSDNEIREFYEKHPSEFLLKDNIVQVRYIKLAKVTRGVALIKTLFQSNREGDMRKLDAFCRRNAVNYFLDDSKWLYFKDLKKEIPIKTYDEEEFLKNNKSIEFTQGDFMYFVGIKGFRTKETRSPMAFEKENIRRMILNKKKLRLIDSHKRDILEQAKNSNEVENSIP
jgi:Fe-S cluster biosynthesis and repair protein YggX